MGFLQSILSWLRGLKASVLTGFHSRRAWPVGSIISGSYGNWKHDPTPTILYLGTYTAKNGRSYVHGLQLHYMSDLDRKWLLQLVYMMKRGGQVVDLRQFYYYIKMQRPNIARGCYRIYHSHLSDYYTVSPGFSTASVRACYPVKDPRDAFVTQLNQMIDASYNISRSDYTSPAPVAYNKDELREAIDMALNTRKVW